MGDEMGLGMGKCRRWGDGMQWDMEDGGMKAKRWIALWATILGMGVSMNAEAGLFGLGGTSWKEEVLLHDGTKIVVERWMKRGGRHEIASGPPIKEHTITFPLTGIDKTTTWRNDYSEDVGSATLILLALHIKGNTPYVIAEPYGCLAYNKWGRPNPPYVIFKHDGASWQRIQMSDLPTEFKTINLVIGPSNEEKALETSRLISIPDIEEMNRDYRQPYYRSILREPLKNAGGSCGEMVSDGKGGWIGIGWFKKQPSRDACLKYCEREGVLVNIARVKFCLEVKNNGD